MNDHHHTVLYAEDDPDDLEMVREVFSRYRNIDLVHVPNGISALEYLTPFTNGGMLPCLIILDINMPVMDGRETLFRLKKLPRVKDIPVILFTTSSNELDKMFAEKNGADFITKPLKYENLEALALEFSKKCHVEMEKRA